MRSGHWLQITIYFLYSLWTKPWSNNSNPSCFSRREASKHAFVDPKRSWSNFDLWATLSLATLRPKFDLKERSHGDSGRSYCTLGRPFSTFYRMYDSRCSFDASSEAIYGMDIHQKMKYRDRASPERLKRDKTFCSQANCRQTPK